MTSNPYMLAVLTVAAITFFGTLYHQHADNDDAASSFSEAGIEADSEAGSEDGTSEVSDDDKHSIQQQATITQDSTEIVNDLVIGPAATIQQSSADLLGGSVLPELNRTVATT